MVNVSIDVTDLGGDARPGDKVVLWRPRMGGSATHAGRVISTAPVTVFLTNGKATVSDVEPGAMTVLLQCRGVESQGPVTVSVPDGDHTVTLRALLESQFEYAPPIVSAVQQAASNAAASERAAIEAQVRSERAADRADAKVDDAINNGANLVRGEVKQDADRAVAARQAATQSESNAKASENKAATSESNAAASETNAKQSETNAGDYAAVATTAATEAVDAMEVASGAVASIGDSVSRAAASADSASQSETNAAQYESSAATHAQNATEAAEKVGTAAELDAWAQAAQEAADRVGTAEQVGTWASESSAAASRAAQSESNAKASEDAAASSASNAAASESAVSGTISRVDALEAMGGLSPESPVDGQTANLIEQPDTLTRGAVGGAALSVINTVSVTEFGAVGDGITDDRAAIQAAIDYVIAKGAGTLYFPPVPAHYSIQSTHPDDPTVALKFDATNMVGGNYGRGGVKIQGSSTWSTIKLETSTPITSLFSMPVRTNNMIFETVSFNANQKADYAMRADEEYHPYINMLASKFSGGLVSSLSLSSYVGHLDRCEFSSSAQDGLTLKGVGGNVVTSTTLTSCYAIRNARYGYNFGFVTYCTLNACAGDHNDVTYNFSTAYGVTMNGCGSEFSRRALRVVGFRRFILNGMYGLEMGAKVSEGQVPDSLIEFGTGMDATVAGVYFNNSLSFTKVLALTGNNYGFENITILDDSIRRHEASFVTNWKFATRPIKFLRGDESTKNTTWNVDTTLPSGDPNSLSSILRDISHMEINHTYTINLSDGVAPDGSIKLLENVRGTGTLIIQGNAADNTAVRLEGGYRSLHLRNVEIRVLFRNVTLDQRSSSGSAHICRLTGSRDVTFDNVRFLSLVDNAGVAIYATESSHALLTNGTRATGGIFNHIGAFIGTYHFDSSSTVDIEDMTAPPAEGSWTKGMVVKNSSPESGGHLGWVRTSAGWSPYGSVA